MKLLVIGLFTLGLMACDDGKKKSGPVVKPVESFCEKTYTDEVSCAADAKCKWEAKPGKEASCKDK